MSEVIVGVEHPIVENCMVDYRPEFPVQAVRLVLMAEDGRLRRVMVTLDHEAKLYTVVDKPPEAA